MIKIHTCQQKKKAPKSVMFTNHKQSIFLVVDVYIIVMFVVKVYQTKNIYLDDKNTLEKHVSCKYYTPINTRKIRLLFKTGHFRFHIAVLK